MFGATAVHEAGHAVVAERLGVPVKQIEYQNLNDGAVDIEDSTDHEKMAMIALGGLVAEALFVGSVDPDTQDQSSDDCDLPKARQHIELAFGPDDVDGHVDRLRTRTAGVLSWPKTEVLVHALAEAIVRSRGLDGEQVRRLIAEIEPDQSSGTT